MKSFTQNTHICLLELQFHHDNEIIVWLCVLLLLNACRTTFDFCKRLLINLQFAFVYPVQLSFCLMFSVLIAYFFNSSLWFWYSMLRWLTTACHGYIVMSCVHKIMDHRMLLCLLCCPSDCCCASTFVFSLSTSSHALIFMSFSHVCLDFSAVAWCRDTLSWHMHFILCSFYPFWVHPSRVHLLWAIQITCQLFWGI